MSRGSLSRRVGLTPALVAINAGLVLFAVACLLGVATVVLRDLGDQQALARLELAGAAALDQVDRTQDELVTSARLLAASSLTAAPDGGSISKAELDRFRVAGDLDGCALQSSGHAFARAGVELPWPAIETIAGGAAAGAPAIELLGEPEIFLVASAPVTGPGQIRAVAVKRLDQALVRSLGERYDLHVTVQPARSMPGGDAEESALRATALATGHAARRLQALENYRDVRVLRSAAGSPVALVETSLPTAAVDGSLDALARRLLLFAALVTLLVVALSAALGRLLTRPLGGMAVAAESIGAGDFNMPIPDAPSLELGSLAATMDRMRQQLRRLTSELERREAEAQALLGGIVEGVFAVDGDRRIRYLNPQTAQLLQIDPQTALGRFCGDVLDPQGVNGVRPCAESCPIVHARSRGASRATERLRLRDGSLLTTVITSAPPVDGRQVQVLRDETDVEAARRMRDAIMANVSHEFKTPLSAQLASIELLRDSLGELEPSGAGQLVQSLERGTLRLQQLVDNLLESVRIEAGAPALRSAPLSIEAVVDAAAELTGPLFAQRAQTLVVDLPAGLPELSGDPPRLTQVFVNLLANANKFAPPGSEIRVSAERRDGEVMLWVEDAGPGLPPGAGGSIFERFVRAPQQEPIQSGMGLGLWIVKSIVEAHGGRVDARNIASGGTRFTVTLPVAAAAPPPLRATEEGWA
jgi:signal transduction histidine kinase